MRSKYGIINYVKNATVIARSSPLRPSPRARPRARPRPCPCPCSCPCPPIAPPAEDYVPSGRRARLNREVSSIHTNKKNLEKNEPTLSLSYRVLL